MTRVRSFTAPARAGLAPLALATPGPRGVLDLGAEPRFPRVHRLHQRGGIPVGNRTRQGALLRGGRARRSRLLQPFEPRRFRGEPLPAHLASRQVPPLQEIIHGVRRDGEQLGCQMDIQDVRPAPSGTRGGTGRGA